MRQTAVTNWSADRMGLTIILVPHRGHAHVARTTGAVVALTAVSDGAWRAVVASNVRASATRATRLALARNPECRMRTKPRGKTCWTKPRRNAIADSVIVRRGDHLRSPSADGVPLNTPSQVKHDLTGRSQHRARQTAPHARAACTYATRCH